MALMLGLMATLAVALMSCEREEPTVARNVVLIIVDTLRRDHLGAYGYARNTSPSIDSLAANGVLFDRAYATSGWTSPSMASMLTGLYPSGHGLKRPDEALAKDIPTLAEALREQGFRTRGVVSNASAGKRFGLNRGFETFDESTVRGHAGSTSETVTEIARSMLAELSGGDSPFFLLAHYFDPHYTYLRHEEYGFAAPRAGRLKGNESIQHLRGLGTDMTEEEISFIRDLYDEEIRHTDTEIGRLLEDLKSRGHYDDTLIVFVADHGEEFLERGWLGHTRTLYDELVRVPLIFHIPGRSESSVVDEPVSLTALPTTIMDLLDLESTHGFPQASLAAYFNRKWSFRSSAAPILTEVDFVPVSKKVVEKTANQESLVGPRFKLIRNLLADELELYDLVNDPAEQDNLVEREPERVREMTQELDAMLSDIDTDRFEQRKRELSDEEIEQLQALGYGE